MKFIFWHAKEGFKKCETLLFIIKKSGRKQQPVKIIEAVALM
jgi:hypothetical protein